MPTGEEFHMTFKSDLTRIIRAWLDQEGIPHDPLIDADTLVTGYLEMLNRRIVSTPREVHFSDEIHDSLGKLRQETRAEQRDKAAEAWTTVFFIRELLTQGHNVNRFLSRRIKDFGKADGLLWDWGMHHLHLNRTIESDAFVERSDYLLFVIVTEDDGYFVDVRTHRKRGNLEWVRQDLLRIVHSNWPHLMTGQVLPYATGEALTDEEVKELRRKNANYASAIADEAFLPIGGGTMADGSSAACRVAALRLLSGIAALQDYFDSNHLEVDALTSAGIDGERAGLELVPLDSIEQPEEVRQALRDDSSVYGSLVQFGFVIVDAETRRPVRDPKGPD